MRNVKQRLSYARDIGLELAKIRAELDRDYLVEIEADYTETLRAVNLVIEQEIQRQKRESRREEERTEEDAEIDNLWEQLKAKDRQATVDPDIAVIGSKLASAYLKKGYRNFRDFAEVAH